MVERIGAWLRAYAHKDGRGYPDWATRYEPIARRLRTELARSSAVLEVGANEAGIARFAQQRPICVDVDLAGLRRAQTAQHTSCVAAAAENLPFRTGSMDVVLMIDTLEHVPEAGRPAALAELVRVLAPHGAGAISFPSGTGAIQAETVIRREYGKATGDRLRWLEEHDAEGLPVAEEVCSTLFALAPTRRIEREGNTNLLVWTWMWRILITGWPGRGNALLQAALRAASPVISRLHGGACYRTLIWILPGPLRDER